MSSLTVDGRGFVAQTLGLFQFRVPALEGFPILLPVEQLVEVVDLPPVTPIPMTPAQLLGVTEWRQRLIPILDLGMALCRDCLTPIAHPEGGRCLVVQVAYAGQAEILAWPVLPGSSIVRVDRLVKPSGVPPKLEPAAIAMAFRQGEDVAVLLDVEALVATMG